MRELQSKTRRNLVVAGAAGLATLAAPQALQTRLAQGVIRPAQAQEIPPRTNEVKVQYGHRAGRWGIGAQDYNSIPLEIYNLFGEGTEPVVEEVQIHFKLDFPYIKQLVVDLISPDGHSVRLLDRPASDMDRCSHKGIDITFVDTIGAKFDTIDNLSKYCPEATTSGPDKTFGIWKLRHMNGIFRTHWHRDRKLLRQFIGRPAPGIWHLKVRSYHTRNVNKVIRQIDLTVYSKW